MKKAILMIALVTLSIVISWIMVAFVLNEIDPIKWSINQRGFMLGLSIVLSYCTAGYVFIFHDDEK